jgi:hypothetical protein
VSLLLGVAVAGTVAVLPLGGQADEARIATEGLRDALVVEGWESLGDYELSDRFAEGDSLDDARELLASGRKSLDAGRSTDARDQLEQSLALHDRIGSEWLRRTELADVHYLLAVAETRSGGDPEPHLAEVGRLVEGYSPPATYGLKTPSTASAAPDVNRLAGLRERLAVEVVVSGELRAGVLRVHWFDEGGLRSAERSVSVAPYAGDELYAGLVSELTQSGVAVVAEEQQPVKFVEVERDEPRDAPVAPTPPRPAEVAVTTPVQSPPERIDLDLDRRQAWLAVGGVALLGGAVGVAVALNGDGAKGEEIPARYTVVIETPR